MLNRPLRAAVPAAFVLCALTAVTLPARAALGGSPMPTPAGATTTTLAHIAHAAAAGTGASSTAATAAPAQYSVRATTYSSGTSVREYLGTDGNVFGIAWNGPRMPDLQSLLGNYFPQYASGVQALHAARPGRGPVDVEQSNLVVRSGGHMGSFFGQAWLPSALPAGVTGADIK
ncbi:DUF2844 domain-containing protein [Trinickia acidisoli]|uniref:DUF2844 domain-containing protein n=1 Tax=Trinickia acidisoli TaxID=2767482 RepID=UPI001A8DD778|nr:DUF2844 domain-containing protein [Trinickia acidisoli]